MKCHGSEGSPPIAPGTLRRMKTDSPSVQDLLRLGVTVDALIRRLGARAPALVLASRAELDALRGLVAAGETSGAQASEHLARLDNLLRDAIAVGAECAATLADRMAQIEELALDNVNDRFASARAATLSGRLAALSAPAW
jgi:hypothetical protein